MLSFVATSAVLLVAIVPVLAEDAYYDYPHGKVGPYPSNSQQYRPVDPYPSYKQPPPAYLPVSRSYIGKRPYSAPVYDGTYRLEPQTGAGRQLGLNGQGQGLPCSPGTKYQCPWLLQCQCKDCSGYGGCKHFCC